MSDRPVAPAIPDVFSSSSPPRSPPPSTSAPSVDPASPHLVPVTLDWVNAGTASFGDDQALQALDDKDDSVNSASSQDQSERRDVFPEFLPPPTTPSTSPRGAYLGGPHSVTPSSFHADLYRTPIKPGARERSNLSPESPSFNPVVGSSSYSTTPTRLDPPFKPIFRFNQLGKSTSDPATPLRFSTFEHGSPWTPDRIKSTSAPLPWTWPPRNAKPDEDIKLHYREPAMSSMGGLSRRDDDEGTPTKVGRFAPSSSSSLLGSPSPHKLASSPDHVATRYVLVEGLRRDLSETDLREMLLPRCAGLSARGCYSARLRVHGEVVLFFHDVRHAVAASRLVQVDSSGQLALKARCITREAFEQLVGHGQASALLSRSEGVLVLTLTGTPTSSPSLAPVSLLAQFGEVRALKVVEERFHVVEYWDDRAAERAHEVLDGREQGGARFECSFEPAVASTDPPSWTTTATATTAQNVAAPLDLFVPPTPSATPRSTTSFDLGYLSPSAPSSTFSFGSAAFAKPFTPSTAPARAPAPPQSRWTAPLPPVAPAGFLHLDPTSPLPQQYQQQPSLFASSVQPRSSTASTASTGLADGPRAAASLPAWPVKHRSHIGQEYGIVRDDRIPASNVLNFERIERGLDVRTTVMIKNIPNKLKDYEVMALIEEVVGRSFDFFYLRTDYSNDCNVGYGFCNFTSTSALLAFAKARLGTRWNLCASDKLCVLSYANIQGKASLINHFRNSSVLDQAENRRPKLFVTSGPHAGEPEPFPVCDDPVRKARSALNASNVGLFPAQRPVFKLAQAFQGVGLGQPSSAASAP
ncbi:hypothetical protein JCM9279_006979 [Rhodotorula babjevae]